MRNITKTALAAALILALAGCSTDKTPSAPIGTPPSSTKPVETLEQTPAPTDTITYDEEFVRAAVREKIGDIPITMILWSDDGVVIDYSEETGEVFHTFSIVGTISRIAMHHTLLEETEELYPYCPPDYTENKHDMDGYLVFTGSKEVSGPAFFFCCSNGKLYYVAAMPRNSTFLWAYEDVEINRKYYDLLLRSKEIFEQEYLQEKDEEVKKLRKTDLSNCTSFIETLSLCLAEPFLPSVGTVVTPTYVTGRGDTVEGAFSVRLPVSWAEGVAYETVETDSTYGLSFYDPVSRSAGAGGWLLTIMAIPDGDGYDHYPSYELIGQITYPEGYVDNLVAIYPTGVEFSDDRYGAYNSFSEQIPAVLAGVTANAGYTFQPAAPVAVEGDPGYRWFDKGPFYCEETKISIYAHLDVDVDDPKLRFYVNNEPRAYFSADELELFADRELGGYSYRYTFYSRDSKYEGQYISFLYNTADNTITVVDLFTEARPNATGLYLQRYQNWGYN